MGLRLAESLLGVLYQLFGSTRTALTCLGIPGQLLTSHGRKKGPIIQFCVIIVQHARHELTANNENKISLSFSFY